MTTRRSRAAVAALAAAAVAALLLLRPGHVRAQQPAQVSSVAVAGTMPRGGSFEGILELDGFELQNGDLVALGRLRGALLDGRGGRVGDLSPAPVEIPVYDLAGSCTSLRLELRATDLELRGRRVRLGAVSIDVASPAGARRPLCDLARRLGDPAGPQDEIPALLSQALRLAAEAGPRSAAGAGRAPAR